MENKKNMLVTIRSGREFDFISDNTGDHVHGFQYLGFKQEGGKIIFSSQNPRQSYPWKTEEKNGKKTTQFIKKAVNKFDPADCEEVHVDEKDDWNSGKTKYREI